MGDVGCNDVVDSFATCGDVEHDIVDSRRRVVATVVIVFPIEDKVVEAVGGEGYGARLR